jgi:hypothetical protein
MTGTIRCVVVFALMLVWRDAGSSGLLLAIEPMHNADRPASLGILPSYAMSSTQEQFAADGSEAPFPSLSDSVVEPELLDDMLKPKPLPASAVADLAVALPVNPITADFLRPEPLIPATPTRKVESRFAAFGASLNSNVDVHERADADDPFDRTRWKADEAVRFPLWGSVYLFGQFGAGCDDAVTQEVNFSSRTGVGWKLPAWFGGDIQLRGGRAISYADTLRPEDAHEHTDVFIELQGQWSLLGPVKLEYSGTALPARTPLEHDRVNQDVRLAFPLRKTSSLRVGAKHNWEGGQTTPKPWTEATEVYLGLSLSH